MGLVLYVLGLNEKRKSRLSPWQDGIAAAKVYQVSWRKVSAMVEEGELTETVDGKRGVAKLRLEKKGPNKVVVTCTERKLGGEKRPDLTFVYQRVVKEEAERKAKR